VSEGCLIVFFTWFTLPKASSEPRLDMEACTFSEIVRFISHSACLTKIIFFIRFKEDLGKLLDLHCIVR
jgi:hypothetical protein